jgi:hypothetical protein
LDGKGVKMPLTKTGEKVMSNMKKEYGDKKARSVFYASMNAKKPGSSKWHLKRKRRGKP